MTEKIDKHHILELAAAYAALEFTKCLNSDDQHRRKLAGTWNLIAETLEREARQLQSAEQRQATWIGAGILADKGNLPTSISH